MTRGERTNQIALRAQAGEPGAIDELLESVEAMVYKMALNYLNRKHMPETDLDDLVQAGRIGVLSALRKWRPEQARFTTCLGKWLIQAFQREASSFESVSTPQGLRFDRTYRKKRPQLAAFADRAMNSRARGWDRDSDVDLFSGIESRDLSQVETSDTIHIMLDNLDCLTARQRQVIDLAYLKCGLTDRSIAKMLGTTSQNIACVKNSAYRTLRKRLAPILEESA